MSESVRGAIDVAAISKHDGFVPSARTQSDNMKPLANPTSFDEVMRLIKEESERNQADIQADIAAKQLEAELLFGRRYNPYEQYEKLMKRIQRSRGSRPRVSRPEAPDLLSTNITRRRRA